MTIFRVISLPCVCTRIVGSTISMSSKPVAVGSSCTLRSRNSPRSRMHPSRAEGEEINAVVLDYIEAWYKGDAERHASAYQPDCIKRAYADNGRDLVSTSPERMVEYCASGDTVLQNARWDIVIDDVAVDVATVRVYSTRWIDSLHLSNAHSRWGLFHVSYRGNTPMADH